MEELIPIINDKSVKIGDEFTLLTVTFPSKCGFDFKYKYFPKLKITNNELKEGIEDCIQQYLEYIEDYKNRMKYDVFMALSGAPRLPSKIMVKLYYKKLIELTWVTDHPRREPFWRKEFESKYIIKSKQIFHLNSLSIAFKNGGKQCYQWYDLSKLEGKENE